MLSSPHSRTGCPALHTLNYYLGLPLTYWLLLPSLPFYVQVTCIMQLQFFSFIFWSLSAWENPPVSSSHFPYTFCYLKVLIIPKYFLRLTKSLHLFETHCAFLLLFNPNIDLLQAVKVTKFGHHLSHDRASKGYGSTCLTSQTSLHACIQRLNTMQISL